MNILFLLKPKINVAYLNSDDTLRNAIEKMEHHHYVSIPVLTKTGLYAGSISEGDILYYIHAKGKFDLIEAEKIRITEVERYREAKAITVNTNIEDLFHVIQTQNYVPVTDDRGVFIGIVTRQDVFKYLISKVNKDEES